MKTGCKKMMGFKVTTLLKTCLNRRSPWQSGLATRGSSQQWRYKLWGNSGRGSPGARRSPKYNSAAYAFQPITPIATAQRDKTPLWVQMSMSPIKISLPFQTKIQTKTSRATHLLNQSWIPFSGVHLAGHLSRNRASKASRGRASQGLQSRRGSFHTTQTSSDTSGERPSATGKHRSTHAWLRSGRTQKRSRLTSVSTSDQPRMTTRLSIRRRTGGTITPSSHRLSGASRNPIKSETPSKWHLLSS